MNRILTYLLALTLSVFWGWLGSTHLQAQSSLGVEWTLPSNIDVMEDELNILLLHNVQFVIITEPISLEQRDKLAQANLSFWLKQEFTFYTESDLLSNAQSFTNELNTQIARYDSLSIFKGIIAFQQSAFEDVETREQFASLTAPALFKNGNHYIRLASELDTVYTYLPLQKADEKSIHQYVDQLAVETHPIVVPFNWLQSVTVAFPDFSNSLAANSNIQVSEIPLPFVPSETPTLHWSIIVLLLLWISVAVNAKLNPMYLATIPRFFLSNRFFVDDVMSYRERSSISGFFLLIQHALAGGLVVYTLSKVFISSYGIEALYHHLPYLGIMGKNYFSLFVVSSFIVFVVELIALVWLYAPNSSMNHFNQVLNLFTWIFHVDFLIVTIMLTLLLAGNASTSILILGITYLFIWFMSFNLTALNGSKRLGMKRNSYLIKTIGLHTLVSGGLLALLLIYNDWMEIIELVVQL